MIRGWAKPAFLPSWTLTSSGEDGRRWRQSHACALVPQQVLCRRHSGEGKSRQGLQKSFLEEVKTTVMSDDGLDLGSLGMVGWGGQSGRAVRAEGSEVQVPAEGQHCPFKGCEAGARGTRASLRKDQSVGGSV